MLSWKNLADGNMLSSISAESWGDKIDSLLVCKAHGKIKLGGYLGRGSCITVISKRVSIVQSKSHTSPITLTLTL